MTQRTVGGGGEGEGDGAGVKKIFQKCFRRERNLGMGLGLVLSN